MNITIGTSIAPYSTGLQKKAIASWLHLGFEVISVNSKKEIEQIKGHFPGVIFNETDRDALDITGKPFVFLDDIFEALHSSGAEVCSIMNSDIILDIDGGFPAFVFEEARNGLVFGTRIDVKSLSLLEGQEYFRGFDYFFFSRSRIKEFHKTDFCLGIPWWDYWLPLFFILKGVPVKQLVTPVAYHLDHSVRWNMKDMADFGDRLAGYLMKTGISSNLDADFKDRIDFSQKHSDYILLGMFIVNYIFRKTEKIFYFSKYQKSGKEFDSCGECALKEMELNYYKEREKQIVSYLEEKLMEMGTSLSWKITGPLRKIYDRINK